ncbi:MAG: hypothetical protein JNM68_00750 [Dinghuibacter sp.]|nr:hypothetical protein [Dinghuibacter sp.]
MTIKTVLIFTLVLAVKPCFTQTCDCRDIIIESINLVEKNYAGFKEKTIDNNNKRYSKIKKKALHDSKSRKNECIEILNSYLSFFKDPHLILVENKSKLIVTTLLKTTGQTQNKKTTVLGFWNSGLHGAKIWVSKKKGVYSGHITSSSDTAYKPGTLVYKFKQTGKNNYYGLVYNKYGQKLFYEFVLRDSMLMIKSLENLTRNQIVNTKNDDFRFVNLNDSVCYLNFPSFSYYYKKMCDSIVTTNRDIIEKSKYLVVDIRNNGGGSIYSFYKLFNYIYTGPTNYVSGYYLASEDHISRETKTLEKIKKDKDTSGLADQEYLVEQLNKNKGGFYYQQLEQLTRDKVFSTPSIVVFLTNDGTASAAEMLLIMAKQNSKTIIAGVNTDGAADFLEPQFYYLCNKRFVIGIPWIKRSRFEYKENIDGIGISPDINLEYIEESKWVNYLFEKGLIYQKK